MTRKLMLLLELVLAVLGVAWLVLFLRDRESLVPLPACGVCASGTRPGFGQGPAVLPRQRRQQATYVRTSPASRLDRGETTRDPREQVIQPGDPDSKILISQHKLDRPPAHNHKVLLEYLL
ncbi:hypothetical protein ACFOSH_03815 [Amycolatopsis speibonae]|uniref:Uncharacterized protein n=1 Tax=Amycolatopsis speibonae TaxID=1450224 RepID=A0ABV7NSF4_9PSEU